MDKMENRRAVIDEANAWFERNKDAVNETNPSFGILYIADFIEKFSLIYPQAIKSILEVGASYGYNLNYLQSRFHFDCYGVEASDKAVEYGSNRYDDSITLKQGLSSDIEFEDNCFDMIIVGFSLYTTPRDMVFESLCEFDRVLKHGGFLVITDFDTPVFCKRINKHNGDLPVYKQDYAKAMLGLGGYTLVEKHSWYHGGNTFNTDTQERVSTQILYKELEENVYYNVPF